MLQAATFLSGIFLPLAFGDESLPYFVCRNFSMVAGYKIYASTSSSVRARSPSFFFAASISGSR